MKRVLLFFAVAIVCLPFVTETTGYARALARAENSGATPTLFRYTYDCTAYEFGGKPVASGQHVADLPNDLVAARNINIFLLAWGQSLENARIKYSRTSARLVSKTPLN